MVSADSGEMHTPVRIGFSWMMLAPQSFSSDMSMHAYPERQSLSCVQIPMQKLRAYGEVRPGFEQRGTVEGVLLKATQIDSPLGQLVGEQLNCVQ